jgi:kinetochore protein Mis12/MTW1
MHSFQTLLEAHTDLAFDFFEAWSHRNIFVINANLPVVAPHHKGLDLETPPETERELHIEVESSRRKLEHVRVIPLFSKLGGGSTN